MRYPCQDCGRSATFKAFYRNRKRTGDPDHDLCQQCWYRRLDAAKAEQVAEDDRDRR